MRSSLLPIVILCATALSSPARAQTPSIESVVGELEPREGLFTVYWDSTAGRVWLAVDAFGEEFLYVSYLSAGLGSNDVGLDRGQLGRRMVVRFDRVGPRVLLSAPNLRFRANGAGSAEALAVTDAFASGIDWAFEIAAETEGRVLIDVTPLLVRDVHGVALALDRAGQGRYRLDPDRSTPAPDVLRSFQDNTEMEALLTFALDNPGRADSQPGDHVRAVAATPASLTLRVRHSFVRLPGPGYELRENHPRSGFFGVEYEDYAAPIGEDMTRRLLARHRLQKKYPDREQSEVVEPIVYYLDRGTPEPVRSALLDGAGWWSEAFDAAGFIDAFRVEMLPEGADALDVRYNVIQWVHRATRGWSYGSTVIDPRTGEIIKGHVSLGSLRVRQDYLLAEGLLSPYRDGNEEGFTEDRDPMLAMALARIRQLSAHEVGHTLGLMHNFAASGYGRASVMDYPAPLATPDEDGGVSLANAYDTGIGDWDVWAIRFGYAQAPERITEEERRGDLLAEATRRGLTYLTDADARGGAAMQPAAALWDNGSDPVAMLKEVMEVRRRALSRFGEDAIRRGRPLATLEEVFVPLYLHHRYQLEATSKLIGGTLYEHAVRGDGLDPARMVDGAQQRAALGAILSALHPEALAVPASLRTLISPRPPGYPASRELFSGDGSPAFDAVVPAEVVATMAFDLLLNPERAVRLLQQHDVDPGLPGFVELLDTVRGTVWSVPVEDDGYRAELQRTTQRVWVDALLETAARTSVPPAVRARTSAALGHLAEWLRVNTGTDAETRAHRAFALRRIERYLETGETTGWTVRDVVTPPGSPIGSGDAVETTRRRAIREWIGQRLSPAEACSAPS